MTHKSMGAAAMAHFDSSSTHTWALERRVDTVNLIRLISLAAIWGASFLFMRMDVPVFGAIYLIGWRTGLAAAFLVLVALWLRRGLNIGVHWRHYLIVGTLNSALPFLMFAFAAKSLPASLLAVLNSLAPSFGAVLAAVWLKTRITRTAAAGLLLGVAGVAGRHRRAALLQHRQHLHAACRCASGCFRQCARQHVGRVHRDFAAAVARQFDPRAHERRMGRGDRARRAVHRRRLSALLPADRRGGSGQSPHCDVSRASIWRAVGRAVSRRGGGLAAVRRRRLRAVRHRARQRRAAPARPCRSRVSRHTKAQCE